MAYASGLSACVGVAKFNGCVLRRSTNSSTAMSLCPTMALSCRTMASVPVRASGFSWATKQYVLLSPFMTLAWSSFDAIYSQCSGMFTIGNAKNVCVMQCFFAGASLLAWLSFHFIKHQKR